MTGDVSIEPDVRADLADAVRLIRRRHGRACWCALECRRQAHNDAQRAYQRGRRRPVVA